MVFRKSHRFLVLGPLINGHFIACKWGWCDHHLRPSWDDPPSTVSSLDKKHLLRYIHQSFSFMISLLYDICMEKRWITNSTPQLCRTKKNSKAKTSWVFHIQQQHPQAGLVCANRGSGSYRFSCRRSTKVSLSTTRKVWHFPNKKRDIFCIYPYPVANEGFVWDSLLNHHQSTSGKCGLAG